MLELLFFISIFILWTIFWSFSSVVISRIRSWEKGIFTWRSKCPKCGNTLKSKDLIPIFSYIINKWKCSYCWKKVSIFYPALEIFMWTMFLLSTYFLIDTNLIFLWSNLELIKLISILFLIFLISIFVIYDLLYFEIPESILFISILTAFIIASYQSFFPNAILFSTLEIQSINYNLKIAILSIFVSLNILWWLYAIMLSEMEEIYDFLIIIFSFISLFIIKFLYGINLSEIPILSATTWALALFSFFYIQIIISKWKWLGAWDLRIAMLMWLMSWLSYIFYSAFLAYIIGSIIWIIYIIYIKIKKENEKNLLKVEVPFGPFLAFWLLITMFFWKEIIEIHSNLNIF